MFRALMMALGALLLLAAGSSYLALYPHVPADLGGVEDFDARARKFQIPVGEEDHVDAWYVPGERQSLVVFFPGYARRHDRAWRYAQFLRKDGYGVLAVDFRSTRFWNRKPTTLGHWETVDARAVLDWVAAQPQWKGWRVALYGESLGGATALVVGAERPDVAAVVVDCPFSTGDDAVRDAFACVLKMPAWPFAPLSRALGTWLTGHDPGTVDVTAALRRYETRPVLLIQSTKADRFSLRQVEALTAASPPGVREWRVADVGHNQAWLAHRGEYERRVRAFLGPRLGTTPPVAAVADTLSPIERLGRAAQQAVTAGAKKVGEAVGKAAREAGERAATGGAAK